MKSLKRMHYLTNMPNFRGPKLVERYYDMDGTVIYEKYENSPFWLHIYDETGKLIQMITKNGYRRRLHYNKFGKVKSIRGDGYLLINKYDAKGNLIYEKEKTKLNDALVPWDYKIWRSEYDENGNKIYEYEEDEYGERTDYWCKYQYDENGNLVYQEGSYDDWDKYEYDENGNLIYDDSSAGIWHKYKYDKNNRLIYKEDNDGDWRKYQYDKNGNLIYEENSNGYWCKYEYDENGNLLYSENIYGNWERYIYEYYD